MADNTYQVEHSKTDRASCKDSKCKQKIGKGVLRIGKEAPSPFGDDTLLHWFHASCAFRALTRAKATTKKIDEMDDLVGHEALSSDEKKYLKRLINGEELWTATGWKPPKGGSGASEEKTSKKRKASPSPKPTKKAKGGVTEKTYLEFFGSKFWEIHVDGTDTHIRFGKVGCSGASQTKSWASHASALTQMEKQIKAKKRSGYKEAGEGSGSDDEEDEEEEEDEASDSPSASSSEEEEESEEEDDWQWQDEDNKWHSYAPAQQKGIQAAIKAKRLFYRFDWGSNSYRVHLKMLYQLNTETSVKRKVRVK